MKNSKLRLNKYYVQTSENKSAFERKLERLAHDPIRYETGANYQEDIGSIKVRRLG